MAKKLKTRHRPVSPIAQVYQDDALIFYLRTNPIWYKILARYPSEFQNFSKIAKEELKLTTHHKLERFKNQMSLLGLFGEYMNRNK